MKDLILTLENYKFDGNTISIEPNFDTWEETVYFNLESDDNTFSFITILDVDERLTVGLNVEQTRSLVDYLQDKLNMMEEE